MKRRHKSHATDAAFVVIAAAIAGLLLGLAWLVGRLRQNIP